jgi:hypothetical protein
LLLLSRIHLLVPFAEEIAAKMVAKKETLNFQLSRRSAFEKNRAIS